MLAKIRDSRIFFTALLLAALIALLLQARMQGGKEGLIAREDGRYALIAVSSGKIIEGATRLPGGDAETISEKTVLAQGFEVSTPEPAAPTEPLQPLAEQAQTPGGLAGAPAPKLTEKSKTGLLPIIASDGTKPWQYYARSFKQPTDAAKAPVIAIVVTGLGHGRAVTEAALALPLDISLSFSPYTNDAGLWVTAARTKGHEALVDMPLQPDNYPAIDPGPQALMSSLSAEENATRLLWLLGRTHGSIGVIAPLDNVFFAQTELAKPALEEIGKRGQLLIFAQAQDPQALTELASKNTIVPNLHADLVVSSEATIGAVDKQFTSLETLAQNRGYAFGIVEASPLTLSRLSAWVNNLNQRGFLLTPVSELARRKFS